MLFLLNENISGTVIQALRERGHDVLAVKESMRGADDEEILARANAEKRLLMTQEKDFGELAFRSRRATPYGVVLFRLGGTTPDQDNRKIIEVLESGTEWAGHFAVVTETQVRLRQLPKPKP